MLILPNWWKHQRAGIANVLRTRLSRLKANAKKHNGASADLLAPYSMTYVCIVTFFGRDFGAFAEEIGAAKADAYLLRMLQWAGQNSAFVGEVAVKRSEFGRVVLSNRQGAAVKRAEGEIVYDSLVKHGIADLVTPELRGLAEARALALVSIATRYVTCDVTGKVTGTIPVLTGSANGDRVAENQDKGFATASPERPAERLPEMRVENPRRDEQVARLRAMFPKRVEAPNGHGVDNPAAEA